LEHGRVEETCGDPAPDHLAVSTASLFRVMSRAMEITDSMGPRTCGIRCLALFGIVSGPRDAYRIGEAAREVMVSFSGA